MKTRRELIIDAIDQVNTMLLRLEVNLIYLEGKKKDQGESSELNKAIMDVLVNKEGEERSIKILKELLKQL